MTDQADAEDEHRLIARRRQKLEDWRAAGPAFPNDFRPDATEPRSRRSVTVRKAKRWTR